jgi:hypothetical protein
MSSRSPDPLLTVRSALVFLLSVVVGLVAAGLGYLDHHDVAAAALIGGGAAGAALMLFHRVLGR